MSWEHPQEIEKRWLGQVVGALNCPLSDLEAALPTFSRKPFTYGTALNEYRDLIVRDPVPEDEREVPVAAVSKRYALIQHRDAVRWTVEAFEQMKWDTKKLPAQTLISDYGERMRVAVQVPADPLDPGDGFGLRPEVLLWNSVDRSRAFELAIRWSRLVCTNGLTIWDEDRLRKVHNVDSMARGSPTQFLADRLPASRNRILRIGEWLKVPVKMDRLVDWSNHKVANQWGITRAARLIHILRTGHDCAVGKRLKDQRASEIKVVLDKTVPGARAPVGNAYHAYQALLWIANAEPSLDMQDKLLAEALSLIRPLLPSRLH